MAKRNCSIAVLAACGLRIYTERYTRNSRYNQELSARWSFGVLYLSRGGYYYGIHTCVCTLLASAFVGFSNDYSWVLAGVINSVSPGVLFLANFELK